MSGIDRLEQTDAAGHDRAGERTALPRVTVLLATHGRPTLLPKALRSMSLQTLHPDRFEVVVVANGPRDGVPAVIAAARSAYPRTRFRLIEASRAGASHARNLGLWAARGDYVTVLDDDDWVSPSYLQGLLTHVRPGVLPLAWLAEIHEGDSAPSLDNYYSRAIRRLRGREEVSVLDVHQGVSINVCKLVPTEIAREVLYDEGLRGGEDFVFWTNVYARHQFRFSIIPDIDVVYYRTRGENSLSRQDTSFDFSVVQRLDCIQALDDIPDGPADVEELIGRMMMGQVGFIRRFLAENPEASGAVRDEHASRGIRRLAWDAISAPE